VTLVLGIDGGGTKTHALVADETGTVLGHATDGPSNWEAVGLRGAGDSLREAVSKVLAAAERPVADVSGSVFGLSGIDWPSDIPRLESVIEPLGLNGPCRILNDSAIALRAGTARPGVVVIAGTGMVVAGRDAEGRTFRTLGLGPPLGDVGSASDVAVAAVRSVADAYVGRGPATTLTEHLCSLTGARSVEELLENYSRGGEPTLLSAAPAVMRAAEDGDQVAISIVTATGEHLGKSAAVVAGRLDLEPGYDLVLAGGLFRSASQMLLSSLLDQVPGVNVVNLTAPPAAGAVVLALEEQGVAVDVALHKRVLEGAAAVLPGSSA
jgi:N-acetylglucosamine kinase-like BadF-type ATPase